MSRKMCCIIISLQTRHNKPKDNKTQASEIAIYYIHVYLGEDNGVTWLLNEKCLKQYKQYKLLSIKSFVLLLITNI